MWTWEKKLTYPHSKLIVTPTNWEVSFYFPGPDLRHNGTFWSIPSSKVDQYIRAQLKNWEKFLSLKSNFEKEQSVEINAEMDVKIRINSYQGSGITVNGFDGFIGNQNTFEQFIKDLQACNETSASVQRKLS